MDSVVVTLHHRDIEREKERQQVVGRRQVNFKTVTKHIQLHSQNSIPFIQKQNITRHGYKSKSI